MILAPSTINISTRHATLHGTPELRTECNGSLRLLDGKDAEPLFGLIDNERDRLRRSLPWVDGTKTVHATREFLEDSRQQHLTGRACRYGIWVGSELAGVASLERLDSQEPRVGYWLGKKFEGHGLVSASVAALCREAFANLRLPRLVIAAGVDNFRSQAVAQRLGFRFTEQRPRAECLYGRWVDHVVYCLDAPR